MRNPVNWAVTFVVALMVLAVASLLSPHDNTDPPDGRSGLRLYTDSLTGCQYLSPWTGGLTPRLDQYGKHICRRPQ